MAAEITLTSWSLVLYPISWLACILYLCLFFSLIFMRLKLNLVNGLYALDFCTSAVFILIEVTTTVLHTTWLANMQDSLLLRPPCVLLISFSILIIFLIIIVTFSLPNSSCSWLIHIRREYWKINTGFSRISQCNVRKTKSCNVW